MSENSVFTDDYDFIDDFENEREKCTIMSIKSNNKDIALDTALLAAEAFTVGVGSLGTYVFGKEFIECLKSENSKMTIMFKGVPVVLSSAAVYVGIRGIIDTKDKLHRHILDRKRHKHNLENFEK